MCHIHHGAGNSLIFQCLLHTDGGRHADCGDEVMAAGMPQAGQSVKLGVERHGASFSILELGPEGSAKVVGTAYDVEALLLEEVGEDLVGVDLLVADLRVLPDLQVSLELITLPSSG
jgi:hypothetical protein